MIPSIAAVGVVVHFPDARVEIAIRQAINKPAGDILDTDLVGVGLTEIALWGHDPSLDMTGIEHCTDLRHVSIQYANVLTLEPLASLPNLKSLLFELTDIRDISPLANCPNLQTIWAEYNSISDLTPLENLLNLRELRLDINLIQDLSPLVRNPGIGDGDMVIVSVNPLSHEALCEQLPDLEQRGVYVNTGTPNCSASPPQITQQPVGGAFRPGATVTLSVQAQFAGEEQGGYLWVRDGVRLTYECHSSLTIESLGADDTGVYKCYVADMSGSVISEAVRVEIGYIQVSDTGWMEEGQALSLTAFLSGLVGNVTYQWTKDGAPIPDQTSNAFHIAALTVDDSGWYGCQVTDESKALHDLPPVLIQVFPEGSLPIRSVAAFTALTCVLIALRLFARRKRTSINRTI